jgi:hypothetical protein
MATHFWMSFCDPDLPEGSQFLGVAIVEAKDERTAIVTAWDQNCNPGGEVALFGFDLDYVRKNAKDKVLANLNRLMDYDEMVELGFAPIRVEAMKNDSQKDVTR